MNKWVSMTILVSAASVVLSGCGAGNDAAKPEPVSVDVETVRPVDGHESLTYSGTIEESETIPLSFASAGTVSGVFVSEGDAVAKGRILASLDTVAAVNAWRMAAAAERRAEDAYNRLTPMHRNGNLPEVKYVEVETGLQQARAAAAIARKSLEDCNLVATTDGIVGRRSVDPGMVALPNAASITLVKISKVFAKVSVPENEIASMKKGGRATVTVGALGGRQFTGAVEEIGVLADPLAHSYRIRIGIANRDRAIRPGMICDVDCEISRPSSGCVVPCAAVLVDERGGHYVYTVSAQNTAGRRTVTVGRLFDRGIEILDGLTSGETVVVAGQHRLTDQAPVRTAAR